MIAFSMALKIMIESRLQPIVGVRIIGLTIVLWPYNICYPCTSICILACANSSSLSDTDIAILQ